nr:class I tRNA ligase family protein [Gammaproteobacteria bacterium]
HIECSAMAANLLGQPFDIHGGGMDLKFPHHENEIAQSEALQAKTFANIWMHVGLLQVNKEKMSKSLNNFHTIQEVLAKHDAELLRYFMISGHYRSPVNYAEQGLAQLYQALERLYLSIRGLPVCAENEIGQSYVAQFNVKMDDDFNTPEALAVLFELAHEINRRRDQNEMEIAASLATTLKRLANIFSLLQHDPEEFLRGDTDNDEVKKIETLIADREQARADKNWSEADRLRVKLTQMGVVLEDSSGGTVWRKE